MFRAALQNVDLFWLILFYFVCVPETGCGSADVDSCHEVKTAYMMRQIGPVELVPDRPGAGQSVPLEISQFHFTSVCFLFSYKSPTEFLLSTFTVLEYNLEVSLLEYLHFLLLYTSTPLHFKGKYCTFYSTIFI